MNTVIDHRTNKLQSPQKRSPEHLRVSTLLSCRSLLITTLLSVIFESVSGTLLQGNGKESVWKYLSDGRDCGKIKVQKYLENAMKNKLSVGANLSWPSLKETFEKCRQTKNIN